MTRTGKQTRVIEVPERPLQLVFGGERDSLFVLAHHSLFRVERRKVT